MNWRAQTLPLPLLQPTGQLGGDHHLNPDWHPDLDSPDQRQLVPAAVLVACIDRPQGRQLLLTQRAARLRAHAGQIAFPGGRQDPEDADPTATALRETREELGVAPSAVELLGRLDPYRSRTGYLITPILARLDPATRFHPAPEEVAAVFEVPLAEALDPARQRLESLTLEGRARYFYAIDTVDDQGRARRIWGVTAGILVDLRRRLDALG